MSKEIYRPCRAAASRVGCASCMGWLHDPHALIRNHLPTRHGDGHGDSRERHVARLVAPAGGRATSFLVPRPRAERYLVTTRFSYPSGDAMGSMIGYAVLAYLLLLGVSRLVLGVHYFTDVAGGFAAGAVWLALSITVMETERRRLVGAADGRRPRIEDGAQPDA